MDKSSVEEIRQRFDNDVERFSNVETGQSATIDAPLVLELIASAGSAVNPQARDVLDVGCGAGNYTLKLLERLPKLNVTLIDLSQPMLDRAVQRIGASGTVGAITPLQGDIRELDIGENRFDIIVAAAVLHHLRDEQQWRNVFAKFHRALRPGGSIWIADLVSHTLDGVQEMMWRRYGQYLTQLRDASYRDHVFAYVQKEDTPRPVTFQLELLKEIGFSQVELLHKNSCFAAFGAVK
jgi:tRNA (cmo5U34)-methyltransferase